MREKLQEGCYYHIYNRGNNGEDIFRDAINYNFFLQKYGKYCYPVLDTYAYCLLKNHFHLLVRVRSPKEVETIAADGNASDNHIARLKNRKWSSNLISQQLGHLFNSYTQAINNKYDRTGSLFERPFERKKINYRNYFCNLVSYIHRNPEVHSLCNDFKNYSHSSYQIYFSDQQTKINKREVLERFGGIESFKVAHERGMPTAEEFIIE